MMQNDHRNKRMSSSYLAYIFKTSLSRIASQPQINHYHTPDVCHSLSSVQWGWLCKLTLAIVSLLTGRLDSTGRESYQSQSTDVADTKTQKSTKPAPASGTICTGSKHCPDRVTRVSEALSSPYFKVNCTFLKNVLPVFLKPNQALQHEKPVIHKSRRILLDFFKSLLLRFVKPVAITEDLLQVEYSRRENHQEDTELMVGEEVKKVLEECSGEDKAQLYVHVRGFFTKACDYAKSKLPLSDEVLIHSEVIDINRKETASFASVKYFVDRFPCLLQGDPPCSLDILEQEFCSYQIDHDIPDEIKECDRADRQWYLIGQLKDDNGALKYSNLAQVMKGVLVIPHSNADCERFFSLCEKKLDRLQAKLGWQDLGEHIDCESQLQRKMLWPEHVKWRFEADEGSNFQGSQWLIWTGPL